MKCGLGQQPLQPFTLQMSDWGAVFTRISTNSTKITKILRQGKMPLRLCLLVGSYVTRFPIRRQMTTVP